MPCAMQCMHVRPQPSARLCQLLLQRRSFVQPVHSGLHQPRLKKHVVIPGLNARRENGLS